LTIPATARYAAKQMGSRAFCISRDPGVRQVVASALSTAGVSVEHFDALPAETDGATLLVVDRATREASGPALCAVAIPVIVVGDDLDDDGLITLMIEAPVSHLVPDPRARELGITSEKLVSGDLFGLEKYLTPGIKVGERAVNDESAKRTAIAEVCAWAESIGARRPIVHRIANVVDELLMNALIDAPRESQPTLSLAQGTISPLQHRALLRWGSDGKQIAVSVDDGFGALRQRDVIDHVRRARDERGRPNPDDPGAGLGLYLVLANVASLIVNVDPGHRTEVVCLFDLVRLGPAVVSRARSLHVFSA
jgi:hypothetical protein